MTRSARIASTLTSLSLALAACSGATPSAAPHSSPSQPARSPGTTDARTPGDGPVGVLAPTTPAGTSLLPPVQVVDVASGKTLDFSTFAPAPTPILLWFWAPH